MAEKARILVVANRTAESPELLEALRRGPCTGPVEFTLLVPATPHGVAWAADMHAGGSEAEAHMRTAFVERAARRGPRRERRQGRRPRPAGGGAGRGATSRSYDEMIVSTLPLKCRSGSSSTCRARRARPPACRCQHVVASEAKADASVGRAGSRGAQPRPGDRAHLRGVRGAAHRRARSAPRSTRAAATSAASTPRRSCPPRRWRTRAPPRPSRAPQQRHALDVRRLREHVHRPHRLEHVARVRPSGGRWERASWGCTTRRPRARPRPRASAGRSSARARRAAGPPPPRRACPERSSSGRIAVRTSPAKNWALSTPLRRAFSIASATASSTSSTPQTSPASSASVERDRADAAEQVEHALAAGQAGELAGDRRRGARPSRCSSGRRRRGRSGSAARSAPPRASRRPSAPPSRRRAWSPPRRRRASRAPSPPASRRPARPRGTRPGS